MSPDQGEREAAIEFARRMCGLTAQLGSPNTYLRPGSLNPNGPWLPHPGNRSDEVFDRLVDSARKFCRTAQDEGVMVAVEGGAVSPLYSARRVRDFIEAVGSPALGFNQDPVNFIGSLEDAYDTTRILDEFFELTGEFTLGAHAKDFTVMDQLMVRFEEGGDRLGYAGPRDVSTGDAARVFGGVTCSSSTCRRSVTLPPRSSTGSMRR